MVYGENIHLSIPETQRGYNMSLIPLNMIL